MPLAADRILQRRDIPFGPLFANVVASGSTVYRGSICVVCSDGTIVPNGSAAPSGVTLVGVAGIAKHFQSNTTPPQVTSVLYGPNPVTVETGCWALPFDTAPTWANKGQPVYGVDDETVSLTETPSGGSARLQVGVLAGLDLDGTPYVTIS